MKEGLRRISTTRKFRISFFSFNRNDYKMIELFKPKNFLYLVMNIVSNDIIHFISAPIGVSQFPLFLLCILLRKKLIIHWIGTDVLVATKRQPYKILAAFIVKKAINLCVSTWLKDELRTLRIPIIIIPIVPPDIVRLTRIEIGGRKRSALAYIGSLKTFYLYGGDKILFLASQLRELRFFIVGINKQKFKRIAKIIPDNVIILGKIPRSLLIKLYRNVPFLIRITAHDGLPNMILEALAMRMHVITSVPLPEDIVFRVKENQLEEAIKCLRKSSFVNERGAYFITKNYDPIKIYSKLSEIYRKLFASFFK